MKVVDFKSALTARAGGLYLGDGGTRARFTRRWRSITSSGKKLPERSLGMRSGSVPTQVARPCSR